MRRTWLRLAPAALVAAGAMLAGCGAQGSDPVTAASAPATSPAPPTAVAGTATATAAPAHGASSAGGAASSSSVATAPATLPRVVSRTARRGARGVVTSSGGAGTSSTPPQSYAFTGDGDTALGAIRLTVPSVLRWTAGGSFVMTGTGPGGRALAIEGRAGHGEQRLAAGTLSDVAVRASGRWTVVIVPAP